MKHLNNLKTYRRNYERKSKILEMLQQRIISVEEAEKLLEQLMKM